MRLNVDARRRRKPSGMDCTAMIAVLVSFGRGRQRLQREQLLPGARADRDPVSDGVANEVIQRPLLPGAREPGGLHVPLDDAAPLQVGGGRTPQVR